MNPIYRIILFLILHSFLLTICLAQNISESSDLFYKLSDNKYKLGNLIIDQEQQLIIFPGKINMNKGLIEVFACAPFGKLHESIIVADVIPFHLQVALILLGLDPIEPNLFNSNNNLLDFGNLNIFVKWNDSNSEKFVRAEDFILNKIEKKSMPHINWIFRGSFLKNGMFAADLTKSLITTYNDPSAIIDNPLSTGQNDETYEVNSDLVPPVGTVVEVVIKVILR